MRTIAFYSYKGGVGRTLLAANLAAYLALLGKRVVIIDLDLEAPGLHYKFNLSADGPTSVGVLGFLQGQREAPGAQPENLAITIPTEGTGTLMLIPAGPLTLPEYWRELAAVDLPLWSATHPGSLAAAAKALKTHCSEVLNADVVLIDSRTGVTDTNALGLSAMADEVVGVVVPADEQLDGVLAVLAGLDCPCSVVLSRVAPTSAHRGSEKLARRDGDAAAKAAEQLPDAKHYRLCWDRFLDEGEFIALSGWLRPQEMSDLYEDYLAVADGLFPEMQDARRAAADARATELVSALVNGSDEKGVEMELRSLAFTHRAPRAFNALAFLLRLAGQGKQFDRLVLVTEALLSGGGPEITEAEPALWSFLRGTTETQLPPGPDWDALDWLSPPLQKELLKRKEESR